MNRSALNHQPRIAPTLPSEKIRERTQIERDTALFLAKGGEISIQPAYTAQHELNAIRARKDIPRPQKKLMIKHLMRRVEGLK